jgi:hypothetical protein
LGNDRATYSPNRVIVCVGAYHPIAMVGDWYDLRTVFFERTVCIWILATALRAAWSRKTPLAIRKRRARY